MPVGSVRIELSVTNVSANRNSFQFCRNRKMPIVARAGRVSGSMICQKIRNSLAPSMRAASSSSFGSSWKNAFIT